MLITSPHNPRIKAAGRLRTGRGRRQQQRTLIDGLREVSRALDAGFELTEVFMLPPAEEPLEASRLRQRLRQSGVPVWDVTQPIFEKLCYGERGSAVVAVASIPRRELTSWRPTSPTLIAVLESVEKPGNVGAILRTADAAGVSGVVLADPICELFNPNVIRASLGAIFTVPVFSADGETVRGWLREHRLPTYVARVDAAQSYDEAALDEPCAVVLGSEADGVTSAWRGEEFRGIQLPMVGRVDSLNVSVTAGVLFYEALRQRHQAR